MIRIGICDDEACMCSRIKDLAVSFLNRNNRDAEFFLFGSGEAVLECREKLDILFLDIQMDNMDGMETAKKLRNGHFQGFLIFTTVLKEMVFSAFEVWAFDYLLKPIEEKQFEKTMERLFSSMSQAKSARLLVQRGCESSVISFDDIVFCEVINRKVYLHLKSSQVIDFYEKMENLEMRLDKRFFKCHRSYLINLNYLKSCNDKVAYMEKGEEVPVSRLRKKELSQAVFQYMKEWGN